MAILLIVGPISLVPIAIGVPIDAVPVFLPPADTALVAIAIAQVLQQNGLALHSNDDITEEQGGLSVADGLLDVGKEWRVFGCQEAVNCLDGVLQHGQFGAIVVVSEDDGLMGLFQTVGSEVQLSQFDLLVLCVLSDYQSSCSLEGQLKLGGVLSLAGSAVTKHAQEAIGEIFELQVELVLGLECFEGGGSEAEWGWAYLLTMLRKMSSSELMQTFRQSRCGSLFTSLPLVGCGFSHRVRSCRVTGWMSLVSLPVSLVQTMETERGTLASDWKPSVWKGSSSSSFLRSPYSRVRLQSEEESLFAIKVDNYESNAMVLKAIRRIGIWNGQG